MSTYNYALSQVFSPALLKRINDPSLEATMRSLLQRCSLYEDEESWNLTKALDITYTYLKRNYRCEYVYKNEIANQILLKLHKNNSATLLKEIASDNCIADIVIINGTTTAYEVKTELDTFNRLPSQLESYQMIYDHLFVVTYPSAITTLSKSLSNKIGLIALEKNGKLKTVREAKLLTDKFNPGKAVLTLRQSELVQAYQNLDGALPQMGTAFVHRFCCNWFMTLELDVARDLFRQCLKSRKPTNLQFDLVRRCHPSLKMMFLGRELSNKACNLVMARLGLLE
ncbi:MAG: sce7726 family protein [Chitinophagaceae bacterium]|nr:sce7726 family protein [Chitinophagaceae bacterium]